MDDETLRLSQERWRQFREWEEKEEITHRQWAQDLKLIGEWVDFYLKRYPPQPEVPDARGIQRMQKLLSYLKNAA